MHGQITKFSEKVGFGVIEAEDGSKYRFDKSAVMNLNGRLIGHNEGRIAYQNTPEAFTSQDAERIYKVNGKAIEEAGDFERDYETAVADPTVSQRSRLAGR